MLTPVRKMNANFSPLKLNFVPYMMRFVMSIRPLNWKTGGILDGNSLTNLSNFTYPFSYFHAAFTCAA